ncbi:hypothetical protein BHK98_12595 [Hornefia porci]|uniref:Uncharacterized protein n=1 Tax=Hornefia porci TaxID=2652292 RepID=A0A1Q9JKV1_9FIRM|nr:hypothetical protein [Hornefia porci]OLR56829.1 hypothetical protein BHK98_12595 [Hornefia porci]
MLGKLLKYEIRAVGRIMLPLYAALLILSVVFGALMASDPDMDMYKTIIAFTTLLLVLVSTIVGIMTLVMIVQRFNKNIYGSEGYLTLTVPASISTHIWNKTISALIWFFFSAVAGVFALVFMMVPVMGVGNVGMAIETIRKVKVDITPLDIVSIIIMAVVIAGSLALRIYASISVGHLVPKAQNVSGIAAFIGFTIIEAVVLNTFGMDSFTNMSMSVAGNMPEIGMHVFTPQSLGLSVFGLAFGAIYYVITWGIMKYRLNLQ